MGIGKIEIIAIIVLVILLLFVGGKKLPELARGIGKTRSEFKKGMSGDFDDEEEKPTKKTAKK
jgi:sec-independent protein translocase protein TatA